MDEVFKAIKNRRSVREYEETHLAKGDIDLLLDAAVWAPTAMNTQQVHFVVVQTESARKKLSKKVQDLVKKHNPEHKLRELDDPIFYNAPLLIILCAKKDSKWADIDCALAAQNMMLAAYSIDIASCFIGFACLLDEDEETRRELGISDEYKIVAPLVFGKARGEYPALKLRNPPDIFKWL